MNQAPLHSVILCGGSGTRLWPLSRQASPKQFAKLFNNQSLLQLTLARLSSLNSPIWCVAADEHRFMITDELDHIGGTLTQTTRLILEPMPRNTAAAMAAAALQVPPETVMLFLPADHHIPDHARFTNMVKDSLPLAQAGRWVVFGVQPTYPATGFGYIQQGQPSAQGVGYDVLRFVEKPPTEMAQQFLIDGGYHWNAGIFLVQAGILLQALNDHAPDILIPCQQAVAQQTIDQRFLRLDAQAFAKCRNESIDHAVIEHFDAVSVVPFAGQWSDVGSWNAVADLTPPQ